MIRTIAKLKFRDSSIEAIKFSDLDFSNINKEGITKYRYRLWLPFDVAKKSVLKGLKLCIYRSTKSKYFTVQYWFKKKPKLLTIGKFIPGVFGTKQVEEKLFEYLKNHRLLGHFRINDVVTALEFIGAVPLGQVRVTIQDTNQTITESKTIRPSLYIIRNHEKYDGKDKQETGQSWRPILPGVMDPKGNK